jgi:CheY-like chemotaxis protein
VSEIVTGGDDRDASATRRRVVHDLNNSIASIAAFGQLIRTDPDLPADLRRQAELLVEEIGRLQRLVGSLVEAARSASEAVTLDSAETPATEAAGAPAVPGTTGPDPARPRGGPPRVLVVDDEPSIRAFLGRVLTRAGYEPVLVAGGAAALEVVRSDAPAAIVCDHRMAAMSGTELLDAVVAVDPRLARRFAFMSGDVLSPELRDLATRRGVRLVAKPFDIATVIETVRALLDTPDG